MNQHQRQRNKPSATTATAERVTDNRTAAAECVTDDGKASHDVEREKQAPALYRPPHIRARLGYNTNSRSEGISTLQGVEQGFNTGQQAIKKKERNEKTSQPRWKGLQYFKDHSNTDGTKQTDYLDSTKAEERTKGGHKYEKSWRGQTSGNDNYGRKVAMKTKADEVGFNLTPSIIRSLNDTSPYETFRHINEKLYELESLLNAGARIEGEFLKDLIKVIATCCSVSSLQNLNPLLTVLKNSSFFSKHITVYLQLIQSKDPMLKESEKITVITDMINICSIYLRHFPSSYFDVPLEMMQRTVTLMQLEEKSQLENGLAVLQLQRDEIIKAERRRFAKPVQDHFQRDAQPPDNYREIQICPTIKELHSSEKPFLRKNIKRGTYEDAEHYLDVQFRLYREDFIAPLREGIQEVVNKVPRKDRNQNIKLYHNVHIVGKEFTRCGIVYRVNFDCSRFRYTNWNHSKRLIFGSFLCLSRDGFDTMLFATVANRDPNQLKEGQFDIHFVEGQEVIGIEKRSESFIIAESPAYFEAYRHVLVGLQELTENNLPFKQYLVRCSPDVSPPSYLRRYEENNEPVEYNFKRVFKMSSIPPVKVLATEDWPQAETLPLNASQLEAFRTALTKEFTVIQGPPGTGKTYVGLKIVRALLENRHVRRRSPMLMVCFTNHALDQFLEGVQRFLPEGIIRVGGRCKNDNLQKLILRSCVSRDPRRYIIIDLMRAWEKYIRQAELCSKVHNNVNMPFEQIEEVIQDRFLNQLYYHPKLLELETISNLLRAWLLNIFPITVTEEHNSDAFKSGIQVIEQAVHPGTSEILAHSEFQSFHQGYLAVRNDENKKKSVAEDKKDEEETHTKSGATSSFEESKNEASLKEDMESDMASGRECFSSDSNNDNSETVTIDTEAQLIQNLRYEEGEEDMFLPIENVTEPDIYQYRNNADVDEVEKRSRQKKESPKGESCSFRVSKEGLQRVNKMLIHGKKFKREEIERIENMWLLSQEERICLYLHWLASYREKWRCNAQRAEETYELLCSDLEKLKIDEDERTLQRAAVIGMTTSCAAKYHSALQRIRPKVVIIEEAAEVLEAHILTSLTQDTEHVILIGDHKQLRPKPTVHQLAQKFNLEISLFERMVLNNMDCKQLSVQHRMRPEIARLTKRIYDYEIMDSPSVQEFQNVRGTQQNLYFIDHTEPETFHEGLQSYSNPHEADFVVALCRYLLQQGYKRSQITILTMYTGQMLKVKEKMPSIDFEGVRLSAVDNFQGEENDIIILSLVRSNLQESVGFLKEPNRICVSLSRAKMALFVIGNFTLMCSQSSLWKDICKDLKNEGKLGSAMTLVCEKHRNVTEVKAERDFEKVPEGGCSEYCEDRLECGHVCVLRCHAADPEHKIYKCRKTCSERCLEGHPCTKNCHYGRCCGKCNVEVTKRFPDCGHVTKTACGNGIEGVPCIQPCERVLGCGHQCKSRCSEVCNNKPCKVIVEKILPCNHIADVPCSKDLETVLCNKPCTKLLSCQHICPGECHESCETQECQKKIEKVLFCGHNVEVVCSQQKREIKCDKPCDKELQCGHKCPKTCREICPNNRCKVKMLKILPCGHKKSLQCSKSPSEVLCSNPCERHLPCGHLCRLSCGDICKRDSCSQIVNERLPCGHFQSVRCGDYPNFVCKSLCDKLLCINGHLCKKKCHFLEDSCGNCVTLVKKKISKCNHEVLAECWRDQSTLTCDQACPLTLACGHRCKLKCGEKCQSSVCKKKTIKKLKCSHTKELPCFQDESEYRCQVKVKKLLPCGHEQRCSCHQKPEDAQCSIIVPLELRKCGHTKQLPCFQVKEARKRKITVLCDTVVLKRLPCGHEMEVACGVDPSEAVCQLPCERVLSCGVHRCMKKCGVDCSKSVCQMKCTKRLKCEHRCCGRCGQDCPPCKEKCARNLPCNHICQGLCSDPCNPSKCRKLVKKQFPCGHKTKKGLPCRESMQAVCQQKCQKNLPCGHRCPGICGVECSQYQCKLPCGRTLICSHRCPAPCYEPCPPCTRPCQRSCVHGRCRKQCWEECEPCEMPCACSCPHLQCNNLCNEICSRPLCNEPCQKKLRCGHDCIGLCGELCPTLCRVCNSKQLAAIDPRGTQSSNKRFVQLFNCGHLFEVSFLDNWMLAESESTDHEQIHLKCCPDCSVPVFFSFRYSKEAKMTTRSLNAVSLELEEMGEALSTEMFANLQRLYKYRQKFRSPLKIDQKFCVTNISVLLKLINETMDKTEDIRREQSAALQIRCAKTVPQVSTEIKSRLQQLVKVCEMMERVLMNQQTDIGVMIKLSQIAIIVSLVMDIVEVKVNIVNNSKTLTSIADGILNNIFDATEIPGEIMAADKPSLAQLFSILAQWKSVAHLEDEVDELRSEAGLTPKQHITIKLVSFPGLCRDTWFTCGRGHVFARCQTTLVSAHQEPVTTTVTECLTCKQSDSVATEGQARRLRVPKFIGGFGRGALDRERGLLGTFGE